ncbi:MAG TPA: FAD:protein FMN transferase [Saprospiraceae bacterium]|nr:FAD:protein FMN transferase [Saprospiraceae bacterium]
MESPQNTLRITPHIHSLLKLKEIWAILLILFSVSWLSCRQENQKYYTIEGQTMGTYYAITCKTSDPKPLKISIDSFLLTFNQSLSTYIPDSRVSSFNQATDSIMVPLHDDSFLLSVIEKSKKIHELTQGAFDPTVMPLVNFYGFGYDGRHIIDSMQRQVLDSLMDGIGMNKVTFYIKEDQLVLKKQNPLVELDFSSIAKGLAVDEVGNLLKRNNIFHFKVDIGGEIVVSGHNPKGKDWVIGINTPDPDTPLSDIIYPVILRDKAIATSGNYRNFYISNNKKFTHIIHPSTGEPAISDVLSASIIAPDCVFADALATACIVLGLEESMRLVESLEDVEACFIVHGDDNNSFEIVLSKGVKSTRHE